MIWLYREFAHAVIGGIQFDGGFDARSAHRFAQSPIAIRNYSHRAARSQDQATIEH